MTVFSRFWPHGSASRASASGAIALGLAACGVPETAPQSLHGGDLAGTRWLASEIAGASSAATVALAFSSSQYAGADPCGGFSGSYATKGDAIAFAHPAVTRRMCDGVDRDGGLVDALSRVSFYNVIDAELIFMDDEGGVLAVFERAAS